MLPEYLGTPEEIYKNVQASRNSISPEKKLFRKYSLSFRLTAEEMSFHTDIRDAGGLLEECAEKESTMISLETLKGCQRRIMHVLLIDPLNREVVYCRNGIGGAFAEGDRDFALMSYIKEAGENAGINIKYCRMNYKHLDELIKNTKRFKKYKKTGQW